MPYSSSLTDQEWKIIEPLLPKKKKTNPPKWSKREILGLDKIKFLERFQVNRNNDASVADKK